MISGIYGDYCLFGEFCYNDNQRGMKVIAMFDSLAQRVLQSYTAAYPVFLPIDSSAVSPEAQKQMYDFTHGFLTTLYDNPGIIGIPQIADGYYEDWEQNNTNPKLMEEMTAIETNFFDFCEYLVKLGKFGAAVGSTLQVKKTELTISKTAKEKLEKIGMSVSTTKECHILEIPSYPLAFKAWKLLSETVDKLEGRKTQRMLAFVFGRYDGKTYKAEHYFAKLSHCAGAIRRLEAYLKTEGFRYLNDEPVGPSTRFAWVKWEKEYSKKETASFCACYDWRKKNPLVFSFRIPFFRLLLKEKYLALNDNLKALIIDNTKNCDSCGYCTQTDKTDQRQRLAMALCLDGKTYTKCPLFPNFSWHSLDDKVIDSITQLFEIAKDLMNKGAAAAAAHLKEQTL
jgi:hypothetical protein